MNTTLTLAGKRVDARRRTLLLGAAGASLAQLSGCGGGNGSAAALRPLAARDLKASFDEPI